MDRRSSWTAFLKDHQKQHRALLSGQLSNSYAVRHAHESSKKGEDEENMHDVLKDLRAQQIAWYGSQEQKRTQERAAAAARAIRQKAKRDQVLARQKQARLRAQSIKSHPEELDLTELLYMKRSGVDGRTLIVRLDEHIFGIRAEISFDPPLYYGLVPTLTNVQYKSIFRRRGLRISGNKAELKKRLRVHIARYIGSNVSAIQRHIPTFECVRVFDNKVDMDIYEESTVNTVEEYEQILEKQDAAAKRVCEEAGIEMGPVKTGAQLASERLAKAKAAGDVIDLT